MLPSKRNARDTRSALHLNIHHAAKSLHPKLGVCKGVLKACLYEVIQDLPTTSVTGVKT